MSSSTTTTTREGPALTVCVTGATGYIALRIVRILLAHGHKVRATVRSLTSGRAATLRTLGGEDVLTLHVADLLAAGAFDDAVRGCDAVLHTASPFFTSGIKDPEAELLKPAQEGTLNVLRSAQAAGVKRLVLTSSFAAVWNNAPDGHVYSEEDWNTHSKIDMDGVNQYRLSKVSAERAAWDFVKGLDGKCTFDVATINPALVIGTSEHLPKTADELNTSSRIIHDWAVGTSKVGAGGGGYVDVDDVALAHVRAMERWDAARGKRFLTTKHALSHRELFDALRAAFPEGKYQDASTIPADLPPVAFGFNCKRTEDVLGIEFASMNDMLTRQVASLKAAGFV
jgi:nucleoside-diphosphate-sugar epimerase